MIKKNLNSQSNTEITVASPMIQTIRKQFDNLALMTERLLNWMFSLAYWLPWTLLLGMLPGVILWQLIYVTPEMDLFKNQLESQPFSAIYAAVSAAVYVSICFFGYRRVKQRGDVHFKTFCQKINRFSAILLIIPIYLFLRAHPFASESPFIAILLCTIAGVIGVSVAYGLPGTGALLAPREQTRRYLPILVVAALSAVWAFAIIQMELTHHESLGTCDWDLGLYMNSMWNSLRGDLLDCSLNSQGNHGYLHFDPILIPLSGVLLIHPGAESLIALQGIWVASGTIPLYLLATRYGKNEWLGVAMAVVYLLHPAIHGPAMYDFHSLMLAGPLLLWCMHFLEAGAIGRYFIFLSLLLITREDMSGIAMFMGLYAFVSKKPRMVAFATILIAALYAIIVYVTVIYHGHSYSGYFEEMQGGHRSVIANIALSFTANPLFMLKYLLAERKVIYILQLVAPLLFLPVFATRHRILFVCGLTLTLLGSKNCLSSISMQYSTWWLPFMLASVPAAIDIIIKSRLAGYFGLDASRLRGALIVGLLLSAFTMSVGYGAFWPNPSFRAGYTKLVRDPDFHQLKRMETVEKIKAMIPPDASVMASSHLVPHFAMRKWIWSVDRSGYRVSKPDYAILWKKDLRSKKEHKVKSRKKNLKFLYDKSLYKRILKENDISVYKRIDND
ncbi:MAG: DUF2079 domain-containing protein [Deltaproteobacteria bacterium]|nr:DUF2079 domain-containing protein [Deltaproteobacteria bacterium]